MQRVLIYNCILFFYMFLSPVEATVIRTRLVSTSAGAEGLAIRIDVPEKERFSGMGAPVVIYMGGGFRGECLFERETNLDEHGFVEIRFNFPGSGSQDDKSGGGPYDFRGPQSLLAARDVIRFAMALQADSSGSLLSELIHPIVPLVDNVGLVGWSNGGNTNICVTGIYGQMFPGLAWMVNWESPVGDGMPQAEAGAKKEGQLRPFNPTTNDAYDASTGQWDLSTLAFDPVIQIPVLDNTQQVVKGGVYFDFNQNNQVDLGSDFIVYPLVFSFDGALKSFYSERLRNEAHAQNLFPQPPPAHIATVKEHHDFWYWRNSDYWIDSVIVKNPDLLFTVVANDTDHVQRSPDHPHVLNQYNRFIQAGCRFVRLNPDRVYIHEMNGMVPPGTVDNDAFMPLDAINIQNAVEPGNAEDPFGKSVVPAAAACELADRSQYDVTAVNLSSLISSVKQNPDVIRTFVLQPNYPNPFNSTTKITYRLTQPMQVQLIIYNLKGNEITTLVNDFQEPGYHETSWSGRNHRNQKVGSGIYFLKMAGTSQVRKMILVR